MSDAERLLAADAAARVRALELESFIVEAPAGAGHIRVQAQVFPRIEETP